MNEDSFMREFGHCPDCGDYAFYEGPRGGMSMNVMCVGCGSQFNYSPLFAHRIRSEATLFGPRIYVSLFDIDWRAQ